MERKTRKPSTKRTSARRRKNCANHPTFIAVARCEVCGKALCRDCVLEFEGTKVCSESCWNKKTMSGYREATAGERALRRQKEKRADRAVTIGMSIVALVLVGAAALFVSTKLTDRTGDKLWEIIGSGYSHNFAADPDYLTVCFASADGTVSAINCLTGETNWTARIPKKEGSTRPRMIDDDTCLVISRNKVFLCGSSRSVPLWELEAPQRSIGVDPVLFDENLYIVSSSAYSHYDSFSEYGLGAILTAGISRGLPEATAEMLPGPWGRPTVRDGDDDERTSTVTAADMKSGRVLWNTRLEDIRVGGLLTDGGRVYVAGSRPIIYDEYLESREKAAPADTYAGEEAEEEEDEDLGTTQLWALNIDTGEPEWKLEGTGSFIAAPAMTDDGIIFATRLNVYLVSPYGRIKWEYPLMDEYVFSIKPTEDTLLLSSMSGLLLCIDLGDGKKLWETNTGFPAFDIFASSDLILAPGAKQVFKKQRGVIPTKRWKGSEDLLEKALKPDGPELEPTLMGLDPYTGEKLWTIGDAGGEFRYADGTIYVLRHHQQNLLMDISADPSELAKGISSLTAYDASTGLRIWSENIDGFASNLQMAYGVILMETHASMVTTSAQIGDPMSVRLIAISLQ